MTVAVLYYHSSIITIMVKTLTYCVSIYDKNKDQSGIGAEYVKTASFFIRTSFSFAKNSLKNHSGPGCKRHGHPDVGEVQTRISMDSRLRWREVYLPCQRHFYALFLHLIRWKRAFFQITSFWVMVVLQNFGVCRKYPVPALDAGSH